MNADELTRNVCKENPAGYLFCIFPSLNEQDSTCKNIAGQHLHIYNSDLPLPLYKLMRWLTVTSRIMMPLGAQKKIKEKEKE